MRPREADEYRAVLGRLHGETVLMTNLIENLLSLARADGGAETIALAPIQVDVLFNQIVETWRSAMNQAMLDFRTEIMGEDLVLLGDSQSRNW